MLCISFVIPVYGQIGSRNLTSEYCANNWREDPVRCSTYVPKDYQPSSQNQQIEQNNIQHNSANDANRICPYGSHLGKDAFGNQACLDSRNNQIVSSPNLSQSVSNSPQSTPSFIGLGNNGTSAGIVVFIIIIVIIAAIAKSRKSRPTSYKDIARKSFTYQTKELIKKQQRGKCASCERYPTHWEFDHINGRGDNSIENCQGLCRDCHQDKTLKDRW